MADGYSREDIARLEKVISKSEALIARQEEIIQKVLQGEENIGKVRIGYLKDYAQEYENILTNIIAKKTSQLKESFLILDNMASDSLSAATEEANKAVEKANQAKMAAEEAKNTTANSTPPSGNGKDVAANDTVSSENRDKLKQDTGTQSANADTDAKHKLDELTLFLQKAEDHRLDVIMSNETYRATLEERYNDARKARLADQLKHAEDTENRIAALESLRLNSEVEVSDKITDIRLSGIDKMVKAETDAQEALNNARALMQYEDDPEARAEARAIKNRTVKAEADKGGAELLSSKLQTERDRLERQYRRKSGGELTEEDDKKIHERLTKLANKFGDNEEKRLEKAAKLSQKHADEEAKNKEKADKKARVAAGEAAVNDIFGKGNTLSERLDAFKKLAGDKDTGEVTAGQAVKAGLAVATKALSNLVQKLETSMDQIAEQKGFIDTRLQGSNLKQSSDSYWDQITKDMLGVGAVSPYFKQEDFAKNIKDLVDRGIAFDLEQRAFLMTIQNKIANTFNAADGTLLRLIRLQQEDSTAGRLGMESALNAFLNEMYENTEYLKGVAESVRGSLQEMEALMTGAEATEVEFQVQKWMGSLYSVGMSQEAVQNIAGTLGKIAAGQIDGLTGGNGAGNLLVMAANSSGKSIADILTDGLDSTETNNLLQAAVNYLASLAESSKGNNVVQQQLANVFGVKASDLRAATNLVLPGTINNVYESSMTYNNMVDRLITMADSMGDRMSMAEKLSNIWANGQYTIAGSMASTPAAYVLSKVATLLQDTTGGIPLPFLNVMGFGVDLETTVADLMRVGAIGTGILGSFGSIISGLGNSFSGRSMLEQMGIKEESGLVITPRGDGSKFINSIGGGAKTTSGSGTIAGNASGSDIKDSTIQEANDSKKQQMIEAKEETEANQVDMLNSTVLKIYELLYDVAQGNSSLRVRVDSYGLTKVGSSSAMGGLDGALSNSTSTSGGGSLGSSGAGISYSESGSVSSGGARGGVDFGGWTTA